MLQREQANAALRDAIVDGLNTVEGLNTESAERLRGLLGGCTSTLEVALWKENGSLHARIDTAQRCKHRACPICSDSKNRRELVSIRPKLEALGKAYPKDGFLKYTLTIPSVGISQAKDALPRLRAAHSRLYPRWGTKGTKYWIEVPVGRSSPWDELIAQPHIHGVALVPKARVKDLGMFTAELTKLWSDALKTSDLYQVKCAPLWMASHGKQVAAAMTWVSYCTKGPCRQGGMHCGNFGVEENSTPFCVYLADPLALLAYSEVVYKQRLTETTGVFRNLAEEIPPSVPAQKRTYHILRWNPILASYVPQA